MNLPNKLVVLRLALVPVFMVFTVLDNLWTRLFALFIFSVAGLTDFYDGYLARKYSEITNFGKFMDPLADKFLISAAFICFVGIEELTVPAWMVVLIIGREFLITGIRLLAASKGEVIPADRSGKFKATSQITAIVSILIVLCTNSFLERSKGPSYPEWVLNFLVWSPYWLTFVTTILTLVSGFSYIYKHRSLLAEESGVSRKVEMGSRFQLKG